MACMVVTRCGTSSTRRVSRRRTRRRHCSRSHQVSVHENLALTDLNDDETEARVPVHHAVLRPLLRARGADLGQLDLRRGVHGYTVCAYSNPVTWPKRLQGSTAGIEHVMHRARDMRRGVRPRGRNAPRRERRSADTFSLRDKHGTRSYMANRCTCIG
jgi:hypothetical protein